MVNTDRVSSALQRIAEQANFNLRDHVMPFWADHTWDGDYGGFLTRLDRSGRWLDTSEKIMIMQVRMIASLAIAHRHGIDDRGYLERATQGFDYLIRTMWDSDQSGFHFSITRDGKPKCTRKNTDFHAYAITAFSEYYLASRAPDALAWATVTYDVLAAKARDGDRGFIEDFDGGQWPVLNAEQMGLGDRHDIKTIDMHTNMLEALRFLAEASGDPSHRFALRKLLDLIVARGLHPEHRCTITAFDYDWNPVPDAAGRMTTSYGLNVELAWLLIEAVDILNLDRERYRPIILGLIDHALEFGFDWEHGGLAANGPMTGPVTDLVPPGDLTKPWWGQAELLNALVAAYDWIRDPRYADALIKLWDWIWHHQIDHECGDWYQDTRWDTGQPLTTDKGGEWKTAFHVSRALVRLSEGIQRIVKGPE